MYNIDNYLKRTYGPGRVNLSLKTDDIPGCKPKIFKHLRSYRFNNHQMNAHTNFVKQALN